MKMKNKIMKVKNENMKVNNENMKIKNKITQIKIHFLQKSSARKFCAFFILIHHKMIGHRSSYDIFRFLTKLYVSVNMILLYDSRMSWVSFVLGPGESHLCWAELHERASFEKK